MRRHRSLLILLLLGLGATLWVSDLQRLRARRAALAAREEEVALLLELVSRERADGERLRAEMDAERRSAAEGRARTVSLTARSGESDPAIQWNSPPETLPDWNPASPYIWVQKSLLPDIPMEPFGDAGSINPGLASVLALDPDRVTALNGTLSRLVTAVRETEAAGAMLATEPIPGIADQPGETLTLLVPGQSDEAARLRAQLELTLQSELGEARSGLVLNWGKYWLDQQFGRPDAEPKVYSVVRHPDDTYGLSIRTAASLMSVDGGDSFMDYIPIHLRSWFEPLQRPGAPAGTEPH